MAEHCDLSEREFCVLKDVKCEWNHRFSWDKWSADMHLTEGRIYASPTNQTASDKLPHLTEFSVSYSTVYLAKLRSRHGKNHIILRWKRGPHFYENEVADFTVSDESYQVAKATLLRIPILVGKLDIPDKP